MAYSGEKPGAGVYICVNCGTRLTLASDDDELPSCRRCDDREFEEA